MPSSEAAYGGSYGGSYRLKLEVTLLTQETGNNRSKVRVRAYMRKSGSTPVWNLGNTSGNTVANGSQANHTMTGYDGRVGSGPWYLVSSREVWINHGSDGKKTASFSAYHNGANSPYLTTASTSLSYTLPAIPRLPTVTSSPASSIQSTTAKGNGNVTFAGNVSILERGIVWNTSSNPTTSNNKVAVSGSTGSFSGNMTGLTPNTTYYFRAFARNSVGTSYGANQSFTTSDAPEVDTNAVTDVLGTTATANGDLVNNGNPDATEKGFVYSTSPNPTIANTKVVVAGASEGAYSASLTGLSPSTTYYIRAYATNSTGTVYGSEESFSTIVPATVITNPPTNVTTTGAIGYGEITSDGGGTVTDRGFAYGTSADPTIDDDFVSDGVGGAGAFDTVISGLTPSETYYVRAYATNGAGTSYGLNQVISTDATPPLQPDNLSPADSEGVSTVEPTLSWRYNPGSANDEQYAYQVIVTRQSDSVEMWDSGKVVSSDLTVDVPSSATLVFDELYQWKVKAWNQEDDASPYSTEVLFKTSEIPTVIITSPDADEVITTSIPEITWTYADPEATDQEKYRVTFLSSGTIIYDTGWVTSSASSYETPAGVLDNTFSYTVRVQVQDSDGIESEADEIDFSVEFVAPRAPSFNVTQDGAGFVNISVELLQPSTDGWYADSVDIFTKKVGELNWTPILTSYAVKQSVLDYGEEPEAWTESGVAREPEVGTAKYDAASVALGTVSAGDGIYSQEITITDLADYNALQAWVFIEDQSEFGSVDIKIGTDSSNYYLISKPSSELAEESWTAIHAKKDDWTVVGAPSADNLDFIDVIIKDAVGSIVEGNILIDQIRLVQTLYSFYDYDTAASENRMYGISLFAYGPDITSTVYEAGPIEIAFTEYLVNTYLIPPDNRANTAKAFMDGTEQPSWVHKTATKYYNTRGSAKPIALVDGKQSYIEGSIQLRFFDSQFGGQGLSAAEHLQSIKNIKPLILRTWWGKNYLISIDGEIDVVRQPGIGWYASFNFTEIG